MADLLLDQEMLEVEAMDLLVTVVSEGRSTSTVQRTGSYSQTYRTRSRCRPPSLISLMYFISDRQI